MKTLPLLVFLLLLTTSAQAAPPFYHVTDLGTLGKAAGASGADGINDRGQIVCHYSLDEGDTPQLPFLWENGTLKRLHLPPHIYDNGERPWSINNRGELAGTVSVEDENHGACLIRGHLKLLKRLGEGFALNQSEAYGINDSGQIVGYAAIKRDPHIVVDLIPHAVLWQNGVVHDLGTLGGPASVAFVINEKGDVVGISDALHGKNYVFLYHAGKLAPLSSPPEKADFSPIGMNGLDQIVGTSYAKSVDKYGEPRSVPVLWSGKVLTNLCRGNKKYKYGTANAINFEGQIVGSVNDGAADYDGGYADHAELWQDGISYDLNKRIQPGAGWMLTEATSINSHGWIVGTGIHNGHTRAFLLTPVKQ